MSLAIGSVTSRSAEQAPSPASTASRAESKFIASEPAASSASEDRFEPSGQAPTDDSAASEATDSQPGKKEPAGETRPGAKQLTPDERRMVSELQARDREVRAHEAAHQAAGGGNVGGASYSYQQGPDGRQYVTGGEVSVDMSTGGGSPEAVIAKMAQVRAAAMAPANPSGQDHAVAAAAAAIAAAAQQQLRAADGGSAPADGDASVAEASTGSDAQAGSPFKVSGEPAVSSTAASSQPGATQVGGSRQDSSRALGAYRAANEQDGAARLVDQLA